MTAVPGTIPKLDQGPSEPQGGYMLGHEFRLPLRVYYEDTDAGGIVYHSIYLNFAERARTEMLRFAGVNQTDIRNDYDLIFAVRSCAIEYLRPATLDDGIEVRSCVERMGGASVDILQDVWRGELCLAKLKIRIACLRGDGPDGKAMRPGRIPPTVRAALERFESGTMATSVGGS